MDTEAAFEHIKDNIKDEKYDMVLPEVKEIVSQCGGDVQILFKCASLLKVVEEEDYCQEILDSITESLPEDEERRMGIAIALRGLGRAEDALEIMRSFKTYVPDQYELSLTLYAAEESSNEEITTDLQTDLTEPQSDLWLPSSIIMCQIVRKIGNTNVSAFF